MYANFITLHIRTKQEEVMQIKFASLRWRVCSLPVRLAGRSHLASKISSKEHRLASKISNKEHMLECMFACSHEVRKQEASESKKKNELTRVCFASSLVNVLALSYNQNTQTNWLITIYNESLRRECNLT